MFYFLAAESTSLFSKIFNSILKKTNSIKLNQSALIAAFLFLLTALLSAREYSKQREISPELTFQHFYTTDGLPSNGITALHQDRKGFIWIGSSGGITRYDGYNFTTFANVPGDTNSISKSLVWSIFEDHENILWIGTQEGGLNCFDPALEKFTRYTHNPEDPGSLGKGAVMSIYEDRDHTIWVGTRGGGLNRLDRNTGKFTRFVHNQAVSGSISSNVANSIFQDKAGNLWIASMDGGLNIFDYSTETFTSYSVQNADDKNSKNIPMSYVLESRSGALWSSTMGNGLFRMEMRKTDGKIDLDFIHQTGESGSANLFGDLRIFRMTEDLNGDIWLATWGNGLLRFSPTSSSFTQYTASEAPQSLSNDFCFDLLQDRSGVLWAGTDNGLNKTDLEKKPFFTYQYDPDDPQSLLREHVYRIYEDNQGAMWIGNGQLSKLASDYQPGDRPIFKHFKDGITGNVEAILETADGNLWIGMHEAGLLYMDSHTGNIIQYNHNPDDASSLSHHTVLSLYADKTGTLWIGTHGGGLNRLKPEEFGKRNANFQHLRFESKNSGDMNIQHIWRILEDRTGIMWVGTRGGLIRYDPNTNEELNRFINHPNNPATISNSSVLAIYEDRDGTIWAGTLGGGLNKYNAGDSSFTVYSIKQGLANDVIMDISQDGSGNLWLATENGISRFDPVSETFRNFKGLNGILNGEFSTCVFSGQGTMYFGGAHGMVIFDPDSIQDNPVKPSVAFTNLQLFNSPVKISDQNSPLKKHISYANELTLQHDQNIITVEFSALHFTNPQKNAYAYKLDGFNDAWSYIEQKREATYTNLDPGEYTLRVKAANSDGVWNNEGASLQITILPPWWRTWWAYGLYAALLLATGYAVRRYDLGRMKLKIETSKLRELDELKSNFFANISHEFRTPLTLILGQIENLQEEIVAGGSQKKLEMAKRNATRLQQLINQLLDLSKIESGKMSLQAQEADIIPLLRALFSSFESIAVQKNIKLEFTASPQDIMIYFDREKFEKIFLNLVSNAIKFTPENGIVSVSISFSSSSTEVVEINVKDSGVGIPADQLPFIFDRFYQVESVQQSDHSGTGIGLALVKELVEIHRWKINVASEEGCGTIFTIMLPLGRRHLSDNEITSTTSFQETSLEPRPSFTADQSSSMTPKEAESEEEGLVILVVEDNPDMRDYIAEKLKSRYKIMEAGDGRKGLEVAREQIPDLIISDVMMPEMDGYELATELRKDIRTSHIPIIMLTARVAEEDKLKGLEAGVDDYLTKPFSQRELFVRVNNLIDLRKKLRQRFSTATIVKPSEIKATSLDEAFLERVLKFVDAHLEDETLDPASLARAVNMSISQVNRKLKALIDQPAGQLIRSMRLQRAADLLKQNAGNVAEIAYKVGFGNQAHFSTMFQKQFGCSPSEYRQRK